MICGLVRTGRKCKRNILQLSRIKSSVSSRTSSLKTKKSSFSKKWKAVCVPHTQAPFSTVSLGCGALCVPAGNAQKAYHWMRPSPTSEVTKYLMPWVFREFYSEFLFLWSGSKKHPFLWYSLRFKIFLT